MSDRPWYKRYPQDFILGTMGMPLEHRGAYSLILDLIYDRAGPIPDDIKWLAGLCGVSVRKMGVIRQALLISQKIVIRGDVISNRRAEKEIAHAAEVERKWAENLTKTSRTRSENKPTSAKINDLQNDLGPYARVPEPEKEEKPRLEPYLSASPESQEESSPHSNIIDLEAAKAKRVISPDALTAEDFS